MRVALETGRRLIGRRLNRCAPANIVQGELIYSTLQQASNVRATRSTTRPLATSFATQLRSTNVYSTQGVYRCTLQAAALESHRPPYSYRRISWPSVAIDQMIIEQSLTVFLPNEGKSPRRVSCSPLSPFISRVPLLTTTPDLIPLASATVAPLLHTRSARENQDGHETPRKAGTSTDYTINAEVRR